MSQSSSSSSRSQSRLTSTLLLLFCFLLNATLAETSTDRPYNWKRFVDTYNSPIITQDYENRVYFAVELIDSIDPTWFGDRYQNSHDWQFEQPLGTLKNHYLFSMAKDCEHLDLLHTIGKGHSDPKHQISGSDNVHEKQNSSSLEKRLVHRQILESDGLKSLQIMTPHRLEKRFPIPKRAPPPVDSSFEMIETVKSDLDISDPLFQDQWHLINPAQPGHDLNVTGVWYQNITGKGIAVAVVDDGLDMDHEDLKANYFAPGSWDFNDPGPDPRPRLSDDRHGTRCCGEIAAVKNDVCGIGVAYDASIAGIRILSKQISEAEEALSLNYAMDKNDIYSCSWGPPDDGISMAEPGLLVRKALLNGIQNGRDEKGSVFVFASGNGAGFGDNCNFDGYTNSIYSITVAAIDRKGLHPFYSESCSANMVVTYSSGTKDKIVTTDVNGQCTSQHGGTSAAAPIAAGVYALVLSTRPDLTWRDLQYLTVDTAVVVNEDDPGWQTTSIGKQFHHSYGYGKLDAYAIVERAKIWQNVKPQAWFFSPVTNVNQALEFSEDGVNGGVKSKITVSEQELKDANLGRLEHVNVVVNIHQEHRGALTVVLTSPNGIKSELAAPRDRDNSYDGMKNWTFMSVVHWGESGVGDWQLHVYNDKKELAEGEFIDWTLKLWGESIDETKAKLFSLDDVTEGDEDTLPTESQSAAPVIPSSTTPPSSESSSLTPPSTTSSPLPEDSTTTSPTAPSSTSTSTSSSIWSLIPTFGLTGRTLSWVYGSIILIGGFIIGVVTYICVSRRRQIASKFKRRPTSIPSYEFDLIPSTAAEAEDEDELFGIDDDEDDDHHYADDDDNDDSRDNHNESDIDHSGDKEEKNSKKGSSRRIYDTYAPKELEDENEIFRVDSEDDSEEETVHGSSGSTSSSSSNSHDQDNDGKALL